MSAGVDAIRVPAKGTHSASVIWLHGLGDTGAGWKFLSTYFDFPHVKWIFPHAPPIRITVNGGMRMPGWFDITSLTDIMARQDEEGMLKSVHMVHKLITEEVDAGISADKIIVGGFSQGCAIALLAGYSSERKLNGIVGLSGWLPLREKFPAMRTDANLKTPLFQAHGEVDVVVNFKFGEMTYEALKKMGIDVEFHEIPDMGHEAQDEELRFLGEWLKRRLVIQETVKEPEKKESEMGTKESRGKV